MPRDPTPTCATVRTASWAPAARSTPTPVPPTPVCTEESVRTYPTTSAASAKVVTRENAATTVTTVFLHLVSTEVSAPRGPTDPSVTARASRVTSVSGMWMSVSRVPVRTAPPVTTCTARSGVTARQRHVATSVRRSASHRSHPTA